MFKVLAVWKSQKAQIRAEGCHYVITPILWDYTLNIQNISTVSSMQCCMALTVSEKLGAELRAFKTHCA